jgi:hypothetical protein
MVWTTAKKQQQIVKQRHMFKYYSIQTKLIHSKYVTLLNNMSVNTSQMDIKRQTCDIRTWKNITFSTYPPPTLTLVPSLYQCVESRSIEVF